jgi:hypothetical protein
MGYIQEKFQVPDKFIPARFAHVPVAIQIIHVPVIRDDTSLIGTCIQTAGHCKGLDDLLTHPFQVPAPAVCLVPEAVRREEAEAIEPPVAKNIPGKGGVIEPGIGNAENNVSPGYFQYREIGRLLVLCRYLFRVGFIPVGTDRSYREVPLKGIEKSRKRMQHLVFYVMLNPAKAY